MGVCRRAALYLARKKGKAVLLFLIFFLVSLLLLVCFSILEGTGEAAKDLRSKIGAAFYIRPFTQMSLENGEIRQEAAPALSRQNIQEILDAAAGQIKAYNTEQYGYAKSRQLHFLPGAGGSEDSSMGQVTAVRDSALTGVFFDGEYTLLAGRPIRPEDENKILISAELAAESGLETGDTVTLTHAGFGLQDGRYIDTIPQKTRFVNAEIVGIFQCGEDSDSADAPTAAKAANHIFSDSHLLVNLGEQQEGSFEGEAAFYITDPLKLDAVLEGVRALDSIDWEHHILLENDFQYRQIAGQLQNLQDLALALIAFSSAAGLFVLLLILQLRIRGRVREAGIYLSAGISRAGILGQFSLEAGTLLLAGFLPALLLWLSGSGTLNGLLFGSLARTVPPGGGTNYLQPDLLSSVLLFAGEAGAVLLAVLTAGAGILRLKPREILTRIN